MANDGGPFFIASARLIGTMRRNLRSLEETDHVVGTVETRVAVDTYKRAIDDVIIWHKKETAIRDLARRRR